MRPSAPFPGDANEHHEHSQAEGYVKKEYEHQEYPKALDFPGKDGEQLIARDAEHEAQLEEQFGPKEPEVPGPEAH